MGLVDDKQGAFIVDIDAIEDLHEHPVFTHQGLFPEFGDDQPQEGVGIQGGEVQIDRVVAIVGQLVNKESITKASPSIAIWSKPLLKKPHILRFLTSFGNLKI